MALVIGSIFAAAVVALFIVAPRGRGGAPTRSEPKRDDERVCARRRSRPVNAIVSSHSPLVRPCWGIAPAVFVLLLSCAAQPAEQPASQPVDPAAIDIDDLIVVDCQLPGKIRRIGRRAVTVGPGRHIRTSAVDCGIRGGVYDIYDRANYETALEVWKSKAQAGDARAQNYLGEMFERGLGTEADYTLAAQWYRRAAEQGYVPAQVNLGSLYEQGRGVTADAAEALEWYRKAWGMADLQPAPQLQPAEETTGPAGAGPVIEMLDPLVPATRGIAVIPVDQSVTDRTIVGRALAQAGLLSLTVNDRDTPVSGNGTFRATVAVPESGTEVAVIAIDESGRRAERRFTVRPSDRKLPAADFGDYHALVIGNNKYQFLPRLRTARADAEAVAGILEDAYGFQVSVMLDATREQLMDALNAYNNRLNERDNLLIYFAGHGVLDEVNSRGYWLPVDAKPDSNTNWIPEVVLTDMLRIMTAKHVLVIADSCYSGSLTRSAQTELAPGQTDEQLEIYYRHVVKSRSRTALTSGGLAPVLDDGADGHSIFANALIEVLRSNTGVLEGQRLFLNLYARVAAAADEQGAEQVPQYAPIKFSGHESGDFLLVPGRLRQAQTGYDPRRTATLAAVPGPGP